MDIPVILRTHSSFLLLLLLRFSSLQLPSSADALPDKYFINCGSAADTTVNGRNFVGDLNTGGDSFHVSTSDIATNPSRTAPPLYQKARFYRKTFWYELEIPQNGTYVVRLHYYPSGARLSSSIFNVSVPGFSLLSNFSVPNGTDLPLIEEFFLTINIGRFRIYFTPLSASLAFVNAIEVFLGFEDGGFVAGPINPLRVTRAGRGAAYSGLLSQVLHTVHRVNVGGPTITPEDDTLGRNWVPDDAYIINRDSAVNAPVYGSSLNYKLPGSTEYIAPDLVYKTAKEMNIDPTRESNSFNVTWRFGVRRNARHLVRAHFCDTISISLDAIQFKLYIYSTFGTKVDPDQVSGQLAAPLYLDFVVDSDNSGFMNVSIGPWAGSWNQTAYLNGLEIMELMKESSFSVPRSEHGKRNLPLIVGLAVGGAALICLLLAALVLGLKQRKAKAGKVESAQTSGSSSFPLYGKGGSPSKLNERSPNASPIPNFHLGLKIPLAEILLATNKFNARFIIGEGGFGKVYKGTLRDGRKVAVKRSEPGHGQGAPEFQSEILVLSEIRHLHLVSFIGYCDDWPEMILVCEFMEKGTLRDHLYHSKAADSKKSSRRSVLSWTQRLEICIGSAKGLHYLHTSSDRGIIHRDVKTTNILLDEHYVAKVADFGLSRSRPPDQTHVSTDVKGSIGYIDPEYFRCLQLTEKSDVYSFGVVLLEVLCARPAINPLLPREQMNLAEWGLYWQHKGELEKIVDPSLTGTINPNSLRKFGETVEKCLRECGAERPHMRDVLWDLEYALQLQRTGMYREPHEDSTPDASLGLPVPTVRRLPSCSFTNEEDSLMGIGEYSDTTTASEVFSEIRIDGAR